MISDAGVTAEVMFYFLLALLSVGAVFFYLGRRSAHFSMPRKKQLETLRYDLALYKKSEAEALLASHAKSFFLANISHEIRTPIHAVLGQLQLLEQTNLTSEQFQYMHQARLSIQILLELLNNVLDFSRLEAGKLELEQISMDLPDTIEQVKLGLFALALNKGLTLSVDIDGKLPKYVKGDKTRLTQVLLNLVGNAIKFTEHGDVVIHLQAKPVASGWQIDFAVQDSGIGIDEAAQQEIFKDFTQAQVSTTRRFGGTGLGLAIASRLVDRMGGELKLKSKIREGSCFYFSIPMAEGNAEEVIRSDDLFRQIQVDLTEQDALAGMVILLVEDDPAVMEMTKLLLGYQGAKVIEAANGREAVACLSAQEDVDVVLMDIQMPVMDGFEATQIIRRTYAKERLPVLAMSAHAGSDDRARGLSVGMDDFLIKPVDVRMLVQAMLYYTRDHKRQSAAAAEQSPAEQSQELRSPDGFELQQAIARMNYQKSIYAATARRFLENIDDLKSRLLGHMQQNNCEEVSRIYHQLKGSALMLGATRLGKHAMQMHEKIAYDEACLDVASEQQKVLEIIQEMIDGLHNIIAQIESENA